MVVMDDDPSLLTIGELARASGLSISALRFYDRQGVLTPTTVDPSSGYRWYAPEQVDDAQLLAALRRVGLPVAESATVVARRDPDVTQRVLDHHLKDLEDGLAAARAEVSRIRSRWVEPHDLGGVGPSAATGTSGPTVLRIQATDLLTGLSTVRHAVGDDPDMPSIHGVFMVGISSGDHEVLRLAASDRSRAAFTEVPAQVEGRLRALLPTTVVDAVLAAGPQLEGTVEITFVQGEVRIASRSGIVLCEPAPEAAFPDLSHAIPKAHSTATVLPENLVAYLTERGISVNPDFVLDALDALAIANADAQVEGTLQLRLDLDGPSEPLAIRRAGTPGTFVVVLPIRPEPQL